MSTELYNLLNILLQVVVWGTMIVTLWVYHGQLQTYRGQLEAMTRGSTGQNIVALVNFLQQEHVRLARTVTRQILKKKSYPEWTSEDRRHADVVCSSYDCLDPDA